MEDLLNIKKNHLIVGRASTAIYLILKSELKEKSKVLVPANVCYAAIYPILYANCIPVFCDCNEKSGNIDLNIIKPYMKNVDAAILPHMYGIPIQDICEISKVCKKNSVLLIEDCASAMGAVVEKKYCGSFGDYSIFSTGYSKTIDLGFGGILFSDRNLGALSERYFQLDEKENAYNENEEFFSKMYRVIRNSPNQNISKYIWKGLKYQLRPLFVFKDKIDKESIYNALDSLDYICEERRRKRLLYLTELKDVNIKELQYYEGAVPWRFSLLVNPDKKRKFINYLLEFNVPVSDWYPNVTPIFGEKKVFTGVDYMEKRIVNFPILIDDKDIKEICSRIKSFYKG